MTQLWNNFLNLSISKYFIRKILIKFNLFQIFIPGQKGIKLDHIESYWILFDPNNFYSIKYSFESDQIKSNIIIFDHIHFYIDEILITPYCNR